MTCVSHSSPLAFESSPHFFGGGARCAPLLHRGDLLGSKKIKLKHVDKRNEEAVERSQEEAQLTGEGAMQKFRLGRTEPNFSLVASFCAIPKKGFQELKFHNQPEKLSCSDGTSAICPCGRCETCKTHVQSIGLSRVEVAGVSYVSCVSKHPLSLCYLFGELTKQQTGLVLLVIVLIHCREHVAGRQPNKRLTPQQPTNGWGASGWIGTGKHVLCFPFPAFAWQPTVVDARVVVLAGGALSPFLFAGKPRGSCANS